MLSASRPLPIPSQPSPELSPSSSYPRIPSAPLTWKPTKVYCDRNPEAGPSNYQSRRPARSVRATPRPLGVPLVDEARASVKAVEGNTQERWDRINRDQGQAWVDEVNVRLGQEGTRKSAPTLGEVVGQHSSDLAGSSQRNIQRPDSTQQSDTDITEEGSDSDSSSSTSESSSSGSGSGYATITPSAAQRNRSGSRPNSRPSSRSGSKAARSRDGDNIGDGDSSQDIRKIQTIYGESEGIQRNIILQRPQSYPRGINLISPRTSPAETPHPPLGSRRTTDPSMVPLSPYPTRNMPLRPLATSPSASIKSRGQASPEAGFLSMRSRSQEHLPRFGAGMSFTSSNDVPIPSVQRTPPSDLRRDLNGSSTPASTSSHTRRTPSSVLPPASPRSTRFSRLQPLTIAIPSPQPPPLPRPTKSQSSRFPQSEFTLYKNRTQGKPQGKSRSTPSSPRGTGRKTFGGPGETPPKRLSHIRQDSDSGSDAGAETVIEIKRRKPRSRAVSPSATPTTGSPGVIPVGSSYTAKRRSGRRSSDEVIKMEKVQAHSDTTSRDWQSSPPVITSWQKHNATLLLQRGVSASSGDDQSGSSIMGGSEGTFSEGESIGASSALGLSFGMALSDGTENGLEGSGGLRARGGFGRGSITAETDMSFTDPYINSRSAYSPSFRHSQASQSQALLHLRILAIVPAMVGATSLLLSAFWPLWTAGSRHGVQSFDALACLPWAYVTASFCFEFTTGLTHRWLLYYSYWPSCVRLVSLQAICWPCTALTVKYVGKYDILMAWMVIGTTTACSRSIQIWVTSNVPDTRSADQSALLPPSYTADLKGESGKEGDAHLESTWKSSKEDAQIWMRQKVWNWQEIARVVGVRLAVLYFTTAWYLLLSRRGIP